MKFHVKQSIGLKARRQMTKLMRFSRKKIGRMVMYMDWMISDFIKKFWLYFYPN